MVGEARPNVLAPWLVALVILAACSAPSARTFGPPAQTPGLAPGTRLERDATATAAMATAMVSPPAPAETAVPDLSGLRGVWSTYSDERLEFTFEYPAAYDAEPLVGWGCGIRTEGNTVFFGTDNSLSVASADGLNLAEYVDRYIQQQGSGFDAWRRADLYANDEQRGIVVEYFVRGVNHSGIDAFFLRDDRVFIFRVWLSLACSAPEIDLVAPGPFYRAVRSFRFTR